MICKNLFAAAITFASCISGAALAAGVPANDAAALGVRYYAFVITGAPYREPHEFIFQTANPVLQGKIDSILGGTPVSEQGVRGKLVLERAQYNEARPFHFDPDSIELSGNSREVCDATAMEIEEHLSEVGGAFLPNNEWCPWSSRLVREVKIQAEIAASWAGCPRCGDTGRWCCCPGWVCSGVCRVGAGIRDRRGAGDGRRGPRVRSPCMVSQLSFRVFRPAEDLH